MSKLSNTGASHIEHLTLLEGMKNMLTLGKLSVLTQTTFVHAGGLDKPATLKFVKVATLNIGQTLSPKSLTQSLGGFCTV